MIANADGAAAHPAPTTPTTVSLPSPPFILGPGLINLRDAGGYAITTSNNDNNNNNNNLATPRKAIRRGLLFRSAELTDLPDDAVSLLQQLGITHVFDLRSVTELAKAADAGKPPPLEWAGATRVFAPVFLDKDYSPEAIALRFRSYSDGPEGFVRAYDAILSAAAEPDHPFAPFQTILNHLASPDPSPVLVHCTAGKDRTGVLIALVLALCDLDDDAIAHEYSLTDAGLAPRRALIVEHLVSGEALFGDRERAERMVSARKENMLGTLHMIRERYGSVERYVTDHLGISPASVEQIRRNLIVDLAEGEEALDWRNHHAAVQAQL